jgi:hypothetical protein
LFGLSRRAFSSEHDSDFDFWQIDSFIENLVSYQRRIDTVTEAFEVVEPFGFPAVA